jgi:hypothetical protein
LIFAVDAAGWRYRYAAIFTIICPRHAQRRRCGAAHARFDNAVRCAKEALCRAARHADAVDAPRARCARSARRCKTSITLKRASSAQKQCDARDAARRHAMMLPMPHAALPRA